MIIVADENIPFIKEALSELGETRLFAGRSITHDKVIDADALLIRSVTRVNSLLLENTKVRFVGSATTGIDHVDVKWLESKGIFFINAAGANSRSVVDYVIAAVFFWLVKMKKLLKDLSVGVIGCGRIGSQVANIFQRLGCDVKKNDPPKENAKEKGPWVSLNEILKCDVVTVHTPLVKTGPYPTYHLCNKDFFEKFSGGLYINTSRGAVCDNKSLLAAFEKKGFQFVLDVWENEPEPDYNLIKNAFIATPHIAGYSLNGRLRATMILCDALFSFFGKSFNKDSIKFPSGFSLALPNNNMTLEENIYFFIKNVYDIESDDKRFREAAEKSFSGWFDLLRKNYPERREFSDFIIPYNCQIENFLDILGFKKGDYH